MVPSRNYIHFSRDLSKIHIYGKVMVTKIVSLVFSSGQHMIWHQKITATKKLSMAAPDAPKDPKVGTPVDPNIHTPGNWRAGSPEKSLTKYLNHTYIFDFHVSFLVGLWTCILRKTNIAGWKMDEDGPLEDLYTYISYIKLKLWVFHIAMFAYRSVKGLMSIPYRVFYWQNAPGVFPSLARYLARCWLSLKFKQPFIVQQCWTDREVYLYIAFCMFALLKWYLHPNSLLFGS